MKEYIDMNKDQLDKFRQAVDKHNKQYGTNYNHPSLQQNETKQEKPKKKMSKKSKPKKGLDILEVVEEVQADLDEITKLAQGDAQHEDGTDAINPEL